MMMECESMFFYYKNNYTLHRNFGFTLDVLEQMLPFERDIYMMLINEELEQKKQKAAQ